MASSSTPTGEIVDEVNDRRIEAQSHARKLASAVLAAAPGTLTRIASITTVLTEVTSMREDPPAAHCGENANPTVCAPRPSDPRAAACR